MATFISHKFRSFVYWARIKRADGYSLIRLILRDGPRRFFKTLYLMLARFANRKFFYSLNIKSLSIFNQLFFHEKKPTYCIIVMPHVLHMLIPCLNLVHDHINVILVHNGSKKWEKSTIKATFPSIKQVELKTFPFSSFQHGKVLDILFEIATCNFGILDHDIYIFDKNYWNDIELNKNQIMTYSLYHVNKKTDLIFPKTFCLYFDCDKIKHLITKYRLSFMPYRKIPKNCLSKVTRLGFGTHNYPNSEAVNFDTCQLIQAMSIAENYQFKKVLISNKDIIHIGGTTYGVSSNAKLYLNALLLELPCNQIIRTYYWSKFLGTNSKQDIVERMLNNENSVSQLIRINTFIKILSLKLSEQNLSENNLS